ncbi:cell adhesion molecule Dscam2 [Anabrus simplex]|uniref:cell adhesion molecule Dscam2 n=1 Tax=Anabrus simplex TaxID=316456 RepID=UPI0035A2E11F
MAHQTSELLQRFKCEVWQHPPYSPDLAPCDYHVFGKLRKDHGGRRFRNVEEVKPAVSTWIHSAGVLAAVVDSQGPVFVGEPRAAVEFSNDTGALLQCTAHGSPTPQIEWLLGDGSSVGSVPNIRELLANGSLYFPPFGAESYRHDVHSTMYRCEASNSVGRILSREVNVRAVVKQHYDVQVRDAYVLNGNTAVLKCEVPPFVKDHIAITSWVQDSSFNIYPSPDSDGKYHMLPTGELLVYSVTPSDTHATYRCRTVHHVTGTTVESLNTGRVVVTEHRGTMPPRFNDRVAIGPVREGETAVLSCVSQGYPPPTYWWQRETGSALEVVLPTERFHMRDGILVLQNAHTSDAGRYLCHANNSAGSERVELELAVVGSLAVHVSPQQLTVDLGRAAELSCSVSGQPTPSITWAKDALTIRDTGSYRIRIVGSGGSRLQISAVTREDRGMYQCFAKNDYEMVQGTAELRLGDAAPHLAYEFIEQTMQPGPSVSLKCIAAGNPTPHFSWTLDGFPLHTSDRLLIGQYVTAHGDVISHVNISAVHVEDGGEYKCVATNRVGSESHAARLNIYGLPHVRPMSSIAAVAGKNLIVKCPVAGFPISSIIWEKDGQQLPINRRQEVSANGTLTVFRVDSTSDRGTYTCTARNKQGHQDSKSVQIEIKVPPRIAPFSFNKDLSEGVRAQVTCVIEKGDPPFTITWLKDSDPIPPGHGREPGSGTRGLKIIDIDARSSTVVVESLSARHTGNFTCLARNSVAEVAHTAQLVVSVPPRWLVEPHDQQAAEGVLNFIVYCQAEGFPPPTITWRRAIGKRPGNYRDIESGHGGLTVYNNGSLYIQRLQEEHEGYYLCEAVNGIGPGLSKVIYLTVNAPAYFPIKHKNQTVRMGASISLRCEVHGDRPLKMLWRKAGSTLDPATTDYRYTVKEMNISEGLASELGISITTREDSGRYYCIATNAFGRDEMSIQLFIQEPPDFPRNLHVIEKGSRFVKLGWILSQDGNSPITQYTVEYKTESDIWHEHTAQATVPGGQATTHISGLRPATSYQFRLFAENELGRSQASDVLDVITDGETPGGPPLNVQVDATSSTELHVTWEPPEHELWNGEILGYHIGYKELRLNTEQYQYKSVENRGQGGDCLLTDLKKFTTYSIVVQAYNALGPGPMAQEVVAITLEDVPSSPPQDVRCTAFTSQSLQVSWEPPPDTQLHGVLKGYKVLWENLEDFESLSKPETKITTALTVVVHGLEKFTNYSIQVLAFTRAGDGVASPPLFCMTEEDVPEAPAGIKAAVSSPASIIVSWLPPTRSNGIITTYNLQVRSWFSPEVKTYHRSLPPASKSYEAEGLHKRNRYEFSVAAVTRVGEGPLTPTVVLSPSNEVQAAIYSFGSVIVVPWKQDTRLPCRHVGKPEPNISWKQWGQLLKPSPRFKVQADGSLQITDLHRDDSGNYSCLVENRYGSDHITHRLTVQVPPSAPLLHATGSTSTSLNVQWKQGDDGGAPIWGYVLYYKREFGEWEEVKVSRKQSSYVLTKLWCGTTYQLYVTAHNAIGMGHPSEVVVATTDGGKPGTVPVERFLYINSTSVTLYLENWGDGGCPILYFEVEYKRLDQPHWTLVSNSVELQKSFVLKGLQPDTEYQLRVKAHNNAGTTTAEYRFHMPSKMGGKLNVSINQYNPSHVGFYLDLKLIIPLVVSALALLLAVLAVYYCLKKRPLLGESASLHESQTAAALDNKQNMEQREQYYATVRKPLRSPVREMATLERIPEYSEDIYPYATFQLNEASGVETRCTSAAPAPPSTQLQTFMYHDPRLSAADTLQVRESDSDHYSKVRARSRRKSKSLKSESEEYDTLGSDSDTEQGTSSRTESSNHLDDPHSHISTASSRGANFIYHGPESSTSTEPSPLFERKSFPRRGRTKMLQLARYSLETSEPQSCSGSGSQFGAAPVSRDSPFLFPTKLDPPTGFSDSIELSEAECDLDAVRGETTENHLQDFFVTEIIACTYLCKLISNISLLSCLWLCRVILFSFTMR